MDIWKWVSDLHRQLHQTGQTRVADLMDQMPDDTCANRPQQVTNAVPEAVAAARALKNPWLEIFFTHWGLSSRLNNEAQGEAALADTVALMELAHREDTQTCPQSVCATQDLAICYGNIDGPGWAAERLAVCEETLARITPAWPCFSCISNEYANALLDQGRPETARDFLQQQADAMREEGQTLSTSYRILQAQALHRLGQHAQALACLDEIERDVQKDGGDDLSERTGRAIFRTHLLIAQGQWPQADELLPAWDDVQPPSFKAWSHAAYLLACHDRERNTWQLGRDLALALEHMSQVGAHFDAVTLAWRHAELAIARGAHWVAQRALQVAQRHSAKLRDSTVLSPQVHALAQRLQQPTDLTALPAPAEQLVDYLQQQPSNDPEQAVQWLLTARQSCPSDIALAQACASALAACGAYDAACDQLWPLVLAEPEPALVIYPLMGLLLSTHDWLQLDRLDRTITAQHPGAALWIRAQVAQRQARWQDASTHLAAYVALDPQALGAQALWADMALRCQDLSTALRLRQALADASETPGDAHWDLLSIASACQDWATVRHVMALLNLPPHDHNEGPVEQDLGVVFIRFEHQGRYAHLLAQRTGPTTARVLWPSADGQPQHLGDWVAFDATLLEPRPDNEEEQADFTPSFACIHIIASGGFGQSCFVDGADCGDALFEQFSQALSAQGWHCWQASNPDYTVTEPATGEPIAGRYFRVSAPQAVTPRQLDQRLRELTTHWPHPVCWPQFAQKNGLRLDYHTEVVDRYGL